MKTLQVMIYRDWYIEETKEEYNYWNLCNSIRRQITLTLSDEEEEELEQTRWLEREMYIRRKILKIINS